MPQVQVSSCPLPAPRTTSGVTCGGSGLTLQLLACSSLRRPHYRPLNRNRRRPPCLPSSRSLGSPTSTPLANPSPGRLDNLRCPSRPSGALLAAASIAWDPEPSSVSLAAASSPSHSPLQSPREVSSGSRRVRPQPRLALQPHGLQFLGHSRQRRAPPRPRASAPHPNGLLPFSRSRRLVTTHPEVAPALASFPRGTEHDLRLFHLWTHLRGLGRGGGRAETGGVFLCTM